MNLCSTMVTTSYHALRGGTRIRLLAAAIGALALSQVAMADRAFGGANPGDLLWENRGQSAPQGDVRAIDGEGTVVVATGEIGGNCTRPFTCRWFVRAHDARTGATLWEDNPGPGSPTGTARAVAVQGGRVFAAGFQASNFVVRAYDLGDGTVLWDRRIQFGGAWSVVASNGNVFVAGNIVSRIGGVIKQQFAVLLLDAQTGATLWESETQAFPFALAGSVRVQGDRTFVAGSVTSTAPSGVSLLVRAHDTKTGAVLWEDLMPDGYFFVGRDADDLAVSHDLLFVAAAVINPNSTAIGFDYIVRAYDVRTGALAWMDHVQHGDGGGASRLGVGAGKVFAFGWDCDVTVFCDSKVRAYDPQTGALHWESRFTGPGGDSLFPADAFAVRGRQVFVGASLLNAPQENYDWSVRSYDAIRGTLQWENRIEDHSFQSAPIALKALGDRLYVAGSVFKSDGSSDFMVRAYRASTDGSNDKP